MSTADSHEEGPSGVNPYATDDNPFVVVDSSNLRAMNKGPLQEYALRLQLEYEALLARREKTPASVAPDLDSSDPLPHYCGLTMSGRGFKRLSPFRKGQGRPFWQ